MSLLEKAGHLLSSYVTYGMMKDDRQFDETFAELAPLVPKDCRRTPAEAFRVIVLSSAEHDALHAGSPIQLRPRLHGSWTKSEDAARLYLRDRCLKVDPGSMVLIVRKPVDDGACLVDVRALYEKLGWNHPDVEEWSRYVEWEQEVVLLQDSPMLSISQADVVASYSPNDPEATKPFDGERVWDDGIEDFVEIDHVLVEQPHREAGVWMVEIDGDDFAIEWDLRNSSWEKSTKNNMAIHP